jgi:hypothetical protein
MKAIPVPSQKKLELEKKTNLSKIEQLVECMLELNQKLAVTPEGRCRAVLEAQIATTDREIDKLVYDLYDLTPDEIEIVEGKR